MMTPRQLFIDLEEVVVPLHWRVDFLFLEEAVNPVFQHVMLFQKYHTPTYRSIENFNFSRNWGTFPFVWISWSVQPILSSSLQKPAVHMDPA